MSQVNTIEQTERVIAGWPRADKVQLLYWLVRDIGEAFPGIEMTAGVMGGAACIRNTRIPVWLVEQMRRLGLSDLDLLRNYPGLTAEDLANAWGYVHSHAADIDAQIAANEQGED